LSNDKRRIAGIYKYLGMDKIKLGIIIPSRGDRPQFLVNCLRMIMAQTVQPDFIEIVNDIPLTKDCDITKRYRIGYERLRNKDIDVIALIEDDDWYAPNYLEYMVNKWIEKGKPNLLGLNHTIYYHLKLRSWFRMGHETRSSAMNTLIKPDMELTWPVDNDPFTDIHLWHTIRGVIFEPEQIICMGIKHGVGKCGGRSHVDQLHRFINDDKDLSFLKSKLDEKSFKFYSEYFTR